MGLTSVSKIALREIRLSASHHAEPFQAMVALLSESQVHLLSESVLNTPMPKSTSATYKAPAKRWLYEEYLHRKERGRSQVRQAQLSLQPKG
jgi:hypothetical protein